MLRLLLLTIWFVGMIYISTNGIRFVMQLMPAFAIAFGVAIGFIYEYLEDLLFHKSMKISLQWSRAIIFILLCLLLITPYNAGFASSSAYAPSITKGWWDSLTQIKLESSPDAIINSLVGFWSLV